VSQGKITFTGLTDGVDCESTREDHRALAPSIPATDAVAKAQAFLSEPEPLLATFDAGYFSPNAPPGECGGQAQAAPDCLPERRQHITARASGFSPQPPNGRCQQKAGAEGLRHQEHAASGKRDR
jgi:hypothetical protein